MKGEVPADTDDVSDNVPPEQYFVAVLPAVAIGNGLTATVAEPEAVEVQPLAV